MSNPLALRARLDQYGTAVADFLGDLDDDGRERLVEVIDAMVSGTSKAVHLDPESAQLIGSLAKFGLNHAALIVQDRNNPLENDRG